MTTTATMPQNAARLTIGGVALNSRVVPAPMCNISDRAYRGLTREFGAHLATTQMVAAEGLIRRDENTWRILDIQHEEPPVCVQLLGSDPASLAEAARIVEGEGAAIVDLNMGCPARKVTGNACGSALMKEPNRVAEIVRAVSRAIKVPFTVKMRAGYSEGEFSALGLARICQDEGAQAIALHARTREQGYKGRADWNLIAELKAQLSIPVLGNGDVTSPADAVRMVRETGCDGVMIGRGIIGNPWLLRACEKALADLAAGRISTEDDVPGDEMVFVQDESLGAGGAGGGAQVAGLDGMAADAPRPIPVPYYMKDVTIDERLALILVHTRLTIACKGEKRGVLEMRKHSQNYVKGVPGCKPLRERLMKIETYADIEALLAEYRDYLAARR